MKKLIVLLIGVSFLTGCASIEKYNYQIALLHSPEELREDIDYSYEKLKKLHPDLYRFIKKDSLDKRFDMLKESIDKPLSSMDFYKVLAPVIGEIRQGHTTVYPPFKRQTRKERRIKGKRYSPFRSIRFKEIDNRIYIDKIYSKDSTLVLGSELLKVNGEDTKDILDSWESLIVSDGYNRTFYHAIKGIRFGVFYERSHKRKDSILLELKLKDSIYTHHLVTKYSKDKEKKSKKETVSDSSEKLSKEEKKRAKQKRKDREKWEKHYVYDTYKKEKIRFLSFVKRDSNIVGYIKIRSWRGRGFKDFYKECFKSIDSAKVKNLVIDLRDNLGGNVRHVSEFYSYLTNKEYRVLEEAEMTRRFSYLYGLTHHRNPWIKSLSILFSPVHVPLVQGFKVKTKNNRDYYIHKLSKETKPKDNNFKGTVYVLINGGSFSASSLFSTHLKATNRAIFVGEETGGSYNATVAGTFVLPELPHSKVQMRFGVMNLMTPYTTTPDGYGVKVDVEIPTTTLETDEQLDWVYSDIKRKKELNK